MKTNFIVYKVVPYILIVSFLFGIISSAQLSAQDCLDEDSADEAKDLDSYLKKFLTSSKTQEIEKLLDQWTFTNNQKIERMKKIIDIMTKYPEVVHQLIENEKIKDIWQLFVTEEKILNPSDQEHNTIERSMRRLKKIYSGNPGSYIRGLGLLFNSKLNGRKLGKDFLVDSKAYSDFAREFLELIDQYPKLIHRLQPAQLVEILEGINRECPSLDIEQLMMKVYEDHAPIFKIYLQQKMKIQEKMINETDFSQASIEKILDLLKTESDFISLATFALKPIESKEYVVLASFRSSYLFKLFQKYHPEKWHSLWDELTVDEKGTFAQYGRWGNLGTFLSDKVRLEDEILSQLDHQEYREKREKAYERLLSSQNNPRENFTKLLRKAQATIDVQKNSDYSYIMNGYNKFKSLIMSQ